LSLIVGYISNAFPTQLSEIISAKIYRLTGRVGEHKEYFPYNDIILKESSLLYETIRSYLEKNYGVNIDIAKKNTEKSLAIFQHCKKYLKFLGPEHISDRIKYLEAQSRMLSSLLLASIANIIFIVPAIILSAGVNQLSLIALLVFSVLTTVVLAFTFHRRRHTEVYSVYSYTDLIIKDKSSALGACSRESVRFVPRSSSRSSK